ncbi:helix-turn-helix transcriptional regulator [Amycolatopsis sp., V23-08]|uniref:Helix-turn-helix transcriptional regulator n=1 Tax=Amycolatopsis heterodermiae TaxID=3110235 RepID=A0ABU5RIG1_9PSEU|nr:helix-turn-helix transcriptional regulator [Amycolatopsis sp., V23-08]MEA5366072.1 helix-turn-helix transcriptional regulator [Amycolatopsis sp., V23-08]
MTYRTTSTSTGIGKHLRGLREQAGLSAAVVAERLGTDVGRVYQIENDHRDSQMSTIIRYCEAIGARVHIGLEEKPSNERTKT